MTGTSYVVYNCLYFYNDYYHDNFNMNGTLYFLGLFFAVRVYQLNVSNLSWYTNGFLTNSFNETSL